MKYITFVFFLITYSITLSAQSIKWYERSNIILVEKNIVWIIGMASSEFNNDGRQLAEQNANNNIIDYVYDFSNHLTYSNYINDNQENKYRFKIIQNKKEVPVPVQKRRIYRDTSSGEFIYYVDLAISLEDFKKIRNNNKPIEFDKNENYERIRRNTWNENDGNVEIVY